MKHTNLFIRIVFILLLLVPVMVYSQEPRLPEGVLDLGKIPVKDRAVQRFLKQEYIKVRSPSTDFRPHGVLPLLEIESVTDKECREVLDSLARTYSLEGHVIYMRDIFILKGTGEALWVSRASGAFKMTRFNNSMAIPSSITPEDAVQIALKLITREQPVTLGQDEELDILYVSGVQNAVAENDDEIPREEFTSDYYIAFGRRYRGIPIIGSRLVVRLDGNGQPAMIQAVWRKITKAGLIQVEVTDTPLEYLIIENPDFQEKFSDIYAEPEDIHIISKQCGYFEAPCDYCQNQMRPACVVSFYVGSIYDEQPSQLILPLEGNLAERALFGKQFNGHSQDSTTIRSTDEKEQNAEK